MIQTSYQALEPRQEFFLVWLVSFSFEICIMLDMGLALGLPCAITLKVCGLR
jgi:hypothetical protein